MSGVVAVYRKELLSYFRSPIAYFVLAVFLVGTGYFFTYNMFMTGSASMNETFRNMGILLLTVSPLVSMRLFAAEYSALGEADLGASFGARIDELEARLAGIERSPAARVRRLAGSRRS